MSKIEFELDRAGVRELLQSSEMGSICESHARRMTIAAGVKYRADVHVGSTRVNAKAVKRGGKSNDSRHHH